MCQTDKTCQTHGHLDRRHFVKLMSLGAGMSLVSVASPLRASGTAKAIMLSCMDFRLVDDLVAYMDGHEMHDEYDHVVLAGASLGAIHEKFADWHQVFWDHVGLAVKLHHVEEIVVIDHRDCGAYKLALGADSVSTPELETAAHTAVINTFAVEAAKRFPELKVKAYLMALDGSVEPIAIVV